ncbi:hypothetical protein EWB00_009607 [Schistosoma japonicum]|uniref:Synaptonemal complex protein n=1 Tax=Schistosoma japonicum TaxID=6182 RepID=A0A4Z2CM83_SCHJA|nr:hypothetical protein EWB00_009607 [Schistosoma japonicum]
MFMKRSYFRQFGKNESSVRSVELTEPLHINGDQSSSLIWKRLENGRSSSTCDLDDDDYFGSDQFIPSDELSVSPSQKTNWDDNKWSKMLKFSDEPKKSELVQLKSVSPKMYNLRNASLKAHANKPLILPDSFNRVQPLSPVNEIGVTKKAPASPMISFLSKKPIGSCLQSPDTQNVSTSSDESVYFHQMPKICSDYSEETKIHSDKAYDKSVIKFSTENKSFTLCDNLEFLYKRLKQEAEKLESWKSCTLSKLEEKSFHLQSYEALLENLRKANVELQMNLETVSLKHKEELALRENIVEKLSVAKQKCDTLERSVEKLIKANKIIMDKLLQSESLNSSLLLTFEAIKNDFLQHSHECLDKFTKSENLILNKTIDLKALQITNVQVNEKNEILEEKLLCCRQQHQNDVTQFQTEIDQLSTENIELKELKRNLISTCVKNMSFSQQLQNVITEDKTYQEKFEDMMESSFKENEEFRELFVEFREQSLYKLEVIKIFSKKLNFLENQMTTSQNHFRCFTKKISTMISRLYSFQERQNSNDEEIIISLKTEQQNIRKLVQKLNERSLIFCENESTLYRICVDLLMENKILEFDRENGVNLSKRITELEKEIEISHMKQNVLKDALQTLQVKNENLQVDNDSLHTQLSYESRKYNITHENCLKAEYLVRNLQEEIRERQIEIESLQEKVQTTGKELEEEKLNCSKVKEMLKFRENKFSELKLSNEENKKALDSVYTQIKEKEEQQEELKRQLIAVNQEKEKSALKQIQLTHNINDVTIQLEYSRQEIGQQKIREKIMQEQNQRLESAKIELQKQNESMMDELLSLKERLDQQANEIKQKQDDIESLREIIDLKNIENSKSNKKVDKKLSESLHLIQKFREQIKELNQEKREILRKHSIKEQELKRLEAKAARQEKELKEADDEKQRLYEDIRRMEKKQNEQETTLAENSRELLKLRSIEKEYQEFKHQIYANSPPVSTQLPREIHEKVTQTPKSPMLSLKLSDLNMIETPTKTPKGILKQPGSATKRRRVFFAYPDYESKTNDQKEMTCQNQGYESPMFKKTSPYITNTPEIHNLQTLEKVTNIRKTPRKTGRKITEYRKEDTEKSWFDCEQIFGYGAED